MEIFERIKAEIISCALAVVSAEVGGSRMSEFVETEAEHPADDDESHCGWYHHTGLSLPEGHDGEADQDDKAGDKFPVDLRYDGSHRARRPASIAAVEQL